MYRAELSPKVRAVLVGDGEDKSRGKYNRAIAPSSDKTLALQENLPMVIPYCKSVPRSLWAWRIFIKLAKRKMSDTNE